MVFVTVFGKTDLVSEKINYHICVEIVTGAQTTLMEIKKCMYSKMECEIFSYLEIE